MNVSVGMISIIMLVAIINILAIDLINPKDYTENKNDFDEWF